MTQIDSLKRIEALIKKKSQSKPIAPIIKIIEQPNYSPAVLEQAKLNERLAMQAIASMRDSVNNNQAVMGDVVRVLTSRPIRFDIERDRKGDMVRIIPVYE